MLAGRALARAARDGVDTSLGRATRALIVGREWGAAVAALDLLADRAMRDPEDAPSRPQLLSEDARYARSVGALVACEQLRAGAATFAETDRADLLARLTPSATSPVALAVKAALTAAPRRAGAVTVT